MIARKIETLGDGKDKPHPRRDKARRIEITERQRTAYIESLRGLLAAGVSERDLATAILKRKLLC